MGRDMITITDETIVARQLFGLFGAAGIRVAINSGDGLVVLSVRDGDHVYQFTGPKLYPLALELAHDWQDIRRDPLAILN